MKISNAKKINNILKQTRCTHTPKLKFKACHDLNTEDTKIPQKAFHHSKGTTQPVTTP